jgi:hypothetical protein
MLGLLLESALRLLALGGIVWLGLKLFRVRNPHVQMTAWTVVLLASLSMPLLMRWVTVTIPAPAPTGTVGENRIGGPEPSVRGDPLVGGGACLADTVRRGTVPVLAAKHHSSRFRTDDGCDRLPGAGDGHLPRRCRCIVAQAAHRPGVDLAARL